MATPYVKQTWVDNDPTKPTSAARLGVIETGIFDAHYRPSVAVYASGAGSIPNASPIAILTYDTELFDYSTPMHSVASNTGRLVAPVAGKYYPSGACTFAANGAGYRVGQMRLNGSTIIDADADGAPSASINSVVRVGRLIQLAAGDYVEFGVIQTSGGSLATNGGPDATHFEMFLASY